MAWLTLRQHRLEILILSALLVVAVAILIPTGLEIHRVYDSSGIARCLNIPITAGPCGQAYDAFIIPFDQARGLMPWLNLLPLLAGILLGAPLFARDFEDHTNRLAWTQGITRRRWALLKVVVALGMALAFAAVLSAVMTWWNGPFDQVEGRFTIASWDFEGLIPFAYAALGLGLGAAAGSVFRRVVPAVAATFAYVPLWLLADNWLRTIVPAPVRGVYDLTDPHTPMLTAQDWDIAGWITDHSGHTLQEAIPACPPSGPCTTQEGYLLHMVYQPASHYWQVQSVEAAILGGLALVLLGVAVWRAQRG